MGGNGDSGGPVLLRSAGQWRLAGLMSWKIVRGDVRTTWPAQYGHAGCNVRVSRYVGWIDRTLADTAESKSATGDTTR